MKSHIRAIAALLAAMLLMLFASGCQAGKKTEETVIAATTWPVYQFTAAVCSGTDLQVVQVVTGQISCLHDYTLTVKQMQVIEQADVVLMSGCNLEEFMEDALAGCKAAVVECSQGIALQEDHGEPDPHIWLDPENAAVMVENIAKELSSLYPENQEVFTANAEAYCVRLHELTAYGKQTLSDLACRELITFHDGFGYFASAFDLTILAALEEEDGAMASAETLEEIIGLVAQHQIPAIFVETNGSESAASVIHAETGAGVYTLDMAMSGSDYFTAVRQNIDTIKEALG